MWAYGAGPVGNIYILLITVGNKYKLISITYRDLRKRSSRWKNLALYLAENISVHIVLYSLL